MNTLRNYIILHHDKRVEPNRKLQDYVYTDGEYQSTLRKIKHYFRRENKVNRNKVSSYCETLSYM